MRIFFNEISRDEVRPGDHIYTWRYNYLYAHHGIFVGDGKVIHLTSDPMSFISSSSPNHGVNPCPNCGHQAKPVLSSCLDCFLDGGSLCRYEYGVSSFTFLAKPRGGSCKTKKSDRPEEVVYRAKYLLQHGFGGYDLLKNNCESFALYCKTGLVSRDKAATSSQVFSGVKAAKIVAGGTAVTCVAAMATGPIHTLF